MNSWHSLVSLRFVTIFAVTFEKKKTQPGRCSFFSNQAVKITGMLDIMVANPFVHLKPTDFLERFCQNWNLQVEIWADFLPQNPSGQTTTTLETRIHPPPQNPPKTITPKINKLKTVRRLPKFKDCNFSGKATRCNGWLNLSPKDKLCNFDGSCTSCDQVTTTTGFHGGNWKQQLGITTTWSLRKMQQPTTRLMSRKPEHLLAFLLSSKD